MLCTTRFIEVSNSKPNVCCEYVSVRWVRETEGETEMGKRERHTESREETERIGGGKRKRQRGE